MEICGYVVKDWKKKKTGRLVDKEGAMFSRGQAGQTDRKTLRHTHTHTHTHFCIVKVCITETHTHTHTHIHTYQLKPCLLVGVCFSSRAVSLSRLYFCSRFIWSTDWQPICSSVDDRLGLWELWKLGQRSFWGLQTHTQTHTFLHSLICLWMWKHIFTPYINTIYSIYILPPHTQSRIYTDIDTCSLFHFTQHVSHTHTHTQRQLWEGQKSEVNH